MGPATEGALRAYQRDRGLKVTGRLDAPTARSLAT
jgi:peptidoglycan hydrolase-like protein with peptidoglycan-binding domain